MSTNDTTPIDPNIPDDGGETTSFFKERLLRDAEKVGEKDIEGLGESVPRKLAGFSLKDLGEGSKWITTMLDRVRSLYDMIRDREYKISGRTKALVGAALIYFVLPTDLTPDFIPGIGYLDDAVVLSVLWKLVEEEVGRFVQSRRRYFPE
jgi:uncharacterized membrane protein YkvA (DUF1232 family)